MALAADVNLVYGVQGINDLPVKASAQIYKGAAVGLSGGYARGLVAADKFVGFALANVLGLASDGLVRVPVQSIGLVTLTIASLAVTDNGALVYASADGTFTLTGTSNSHIGRVHRWIATGSGIISFNADITNANI